MHSFDPDIAARVGVNAAVLYQNIVWWCAKNAANRVNVHDGRYWTFNSVKAWGELFPYLTGKQIRSALDKLEEEGLILSGIFNKSGYDRTKWYCPAGQIDLPQKANGIASEGEPIPDINTDLNTDSKHRESARACQIPEEWCPSDKNIADAEARGFTEQEISNEADKFRDYHLARGSKFKDWNAAWRTWLRNSRQFADRQLARQPHAVSGGKGVSLASIVAQRRAGRDL